jgi:hypothetical protein
MQRQVGVVKKGAGLGCELFMAIAALIHSAELASLAMGVITSNPVRLAVNALNTVWPAHIYKVLDAMPFVCELCSNLVKPHGSTSIQEQWYP